MNIDELRYLVRKFMFFTTKIFPKTGLAVRSLSGHGYSPGLYYWKSMGRLIGYMKQMELRGFIYVEPDSLKSVSLDDTDYGDGNETQPDV